MSKKICNNESEYFKAMKEVYFLLFSFRDILDKMAYDREFDSAAAFEKFILDEKVLDRLAEIRSLLEEPFDRNSSMYPSDGDYTFLEQLYRDIKLWKVKCLCIPKGN